MERPTPRAGGSTPSRVGNVRALQGRRECQRTESTTNEALGSYGSLQLSYCNTSVCSSECFRGELLINSRRIRWVPFDDCSWPGMRNAHGGGLGDPPTSSLLPTCIEYHLINLATVNIVQWERRQNDDLRFIFAPQTDGYSRISSPESQELEGQLLMQPCTVQSGLYKCYT
jgi:hypothetical protein